VFLVWIEIHKLDFPRLSAEHQVEKMWDDVRMTYRSWDDAVNAIEESVGPAEENQKKLASLVGINLSSNLSKQVAGSRLMFALAKELCIPVPKPCTDAQLELLPILNEMNLDIPIPSNQNEFRMLLDYVRLKHR
jgi:hypothetical protein